MKPQVFLFLFVFMLLVMPLQAYAVGGEITNPVQGGKGAGYQINSLLSSAYRAAYSFLSNSLTGKVIDEGGRKESYRADFDLYDASNNDVPVGTANKGSQGRQKSIAPGSILKIELGR